jgi:hypothetical protein
MVVGLSIGGLVNGGWFKPGGGLVDQQGVSGETGVPLAAIGIEDPERRPAARRAVAVVRDERFRALADDVAAQVDPRPAGQLEPDAGRLVDRGRQAAGESGGMEDQQQGLRSPGESGEPMESLGDPGRLVGPCQSTARQVEDQHVDRPPGQEAAGDAESFIEAGRGDDDEPLEVDAAGGRLDRVEAARQVEPRDDASGRLRLSGHPEAQRRPPAGPRATDRDAGRLRETARPEDRIERGEARADDAVIWSGVVLGLVLHGIRHQCQRADNLRSCGTPPSPEARDSGVHITPTSRHEMVILEQMF